MFNHQTPAEEPLTVTWIQECLICSELALFNFIYQISKISSASLTEFHFLTQSLYWYL